MVLPLIPIAFAMMAAGASTGAAANLYSQAKQRDLYRYQRNAYVRQLKDWHKNVPKRSIKYPELSYPGAIRSLDTGIAQSYAASAGTIGRALGTTGGSAFAYSRVRSRGLYSFNPRTSRWF